MSEDRRIRLTGAFGNLILCLSDDIVNMEQGTPFTLVILRGGDKLIVKDSLREISDKIEAAEVRRDV